MERDVAIAATAVLRSVCVPLTGSQVDALIALTFNIGVAAFYSSTVLKRINVGDFAGVPDAFRMWNKETIGGKKVVNRGLVRRREAELGLWGTSA